jgi:hypothetical protein
LSESPSALAVPANSPTVPNLPPDHTTKVQGKEIAALPLKNAFFVFFHLVHDKN